MAAAAVAATTTFAIPEFFNAVRGSLWGMFVADALSMPVHWYYNVGAIDSDFGLITDYQPPKGLNCSGCLFQLVIGLLCETILTFPLSYEAKITQLLRELMPNFTIYAGE